MHTDPIRAALEQAGCTVQELEAIPPGRGAARLLLAGWRGLNLLFLVVDPTRSTIVTPTEEDWVKAWGGIVYPVSGAGDALRCLNLSETP